MTNYIYNNKLIGKKQLKQLLAWSFSNYNCIEACTLADELKYLGFKYATKAGLSISIEDLKVPFIKHEMLQNANKNIKNVEKICLKGKITDVEKFQKVINTWSITSESLKNEVISYFKNYDPLNSVYIMAFSGARGNVSQVRQLVGMRGLMADPSGAILKLPIKKNFREGLTITDYLMSAYGARKGIVDTALKTANSGYLTRRLIDVAQDILIREKDCFSNYSYLIFEQDIEKIEKKIIGRLLNKSIYIPKTQKLLANVNTQITSNLLNICKQYKIKKFYIRSPLTCQLYRSVCQRCYGWDIAKENLIDFGEAVGIIAGQSIGEPGTQLTMRTFHTGGIFTSELSQQIKSPISGLIKLSKILKTKFLRTNKGENVLITKNSGSLTIIPEKNGAKLIHIELDRNTILFAKNNQYVKQNTTIGELLTNKKQIRTEIRPIFAPNSGEIIIPRLKNKQHIIKKNLLLWLLSGQVYKGPLNSFLNYYSDYKINQKNYIFRTKIVIPFSGIVSQTNEKFNLVQKCIEISNRNYFLCNCYIKKWYINLWIKKYILTYKNSNYILNQNHVNISKCLGSLLTNKFKTLTGGISYSLNPKNILSANKIYYYKSTDNFVFKYILQEIICFIEMIWLIDKISDKNWMIKNFEKKWKRQLINIWNKIHTNIYPKSLTKTNYIKISNTLLWINEETHNLNCAKNMLLVEDGNFISKNFEIFPNTFSKTQGIVAFLQIGNIVQKIWIKSGAVYQGDKIENFSKNFYFPGETIANNIIISKPSFCEIITIENTNQLLIRPVDVYEIPIINSLNNLLQTTLQLNLILDFTNIIKHFYKSSQRIERNFSINLISNILKLKPDINLTNNINIKILPNLKQQLLEILLTKTLFINHYILPNLKYSNINTCLLLEQNQYLNSYSIIGYLESITNKSLKIVKIKSKQTEIKQIFLISNKDCIVINRNHSNGKKINQLVINTQNLNYSGRIIIDNGQFVTIQKGKPYFFPNCKNDDSQLSQNIKYTVFDQNNKLFEKIIAKNHYINLKYFDITKKCLIEKLFNYKSFCSINQKIDVGIKIEFSKMFIEKNTKVYIKTIPILLKNALIQNPKFETKALAKLKPVSTFQKLKKKKIKKLYVFFKTTNLSFNYIRNNFNSEENSVMLLKILTTPFQNSIGIYPITENYFDEDYNSVLCKNNQFIENGQMLGLLTFEKEITGDIVQGLPRIEQLFEARKVRTMYKLIPLNKKKHLLIQQTSIDSSFEFKKLGITIKENGKINPHNLLKIYFNYYGSNRRFFCDQNKTFLVTKLMDNFEASYRTFKKVQSLILNLIQAVYKSQGVSIIDKHFEIIIKQMTTKVLITYEGNSPLLPREVIDLYHIKYINKIIKFHNKKPAYYVPILFGITKAALNNPSFISAASFQETTRVLTKAAIEGKLDWLRGLKENIIIGGLIPAGTGSQTYINCFKKKLTKTAQSKLQLKNLN
uniref:DNA-directed RNA polymerase subunit beta'' n=1 Tax=Toxarium undulatum TaxID=210620 RepID=A0A1D8DCP5_9STRA|nr:RNA polymerase b''-subunit [Toxarium undulatum]AOS86604.1 RNA polymerase b''-subunit [Toxarium undulatum]